MFKPSYGICVCHNQKRLIVVKSGFCKQGNDERKGKSSNIQNSKKPKYAKPKVKQKIQRSKKIFVRKKTREKDAETNEIIFGGPRCGIPKNRSDFRKRSTKIASSKNDFGGNNRKISVNMGRNTQSKGLSNRKKVTGEKGLFLDIWSERLHICQVCEKGLGDEPIVHFFSHILPKSIYKKFRLDKRNIWLCCFECHYQYEFGNKSDPKFTKKNKLAEQLKQEYNNQ